MVPAATTVGGYLQSLPNDRRVAMARVCSMIRRSARGVRESMRFGLAFYELDGSFMMEIYEERKVAGMSGAINNIALDCTDIEAAYTAANDAGLRVVSNGIEALAFWKNGVRFFIVEGPNKERVEFCQML